MKKKAVLMKCWITSKTAPTNAAKAESRNTVRAQNFVQNKKSTSF